MNKIKILIADDERPAREFLKRLLSGFEEVELVAEAEDGESAVLSIKEHRPDLALLDLQMPGLSGLEVVRSLHHSYLPLVAFVTAFDEYAVKAFELNAIDYLLKPVEKARLQETIKRAVERMEKDDWRDAEAAKLKNALASYDEGRSTDTLERIPVKLRDEYLLVPINEVASIIADGELLNIHTNDNRRYTINFRLKDIENRLDEKLFVRLSRGALVNLQMISHISPMPGGTYLVGLNNGQELSSSRLQSKILRSRLLKI